MIWCNDPVSLAKMLDKVAVKKGPSWVAMKHEHHFTSPLINVVITMFMRGVGKLRLERVEFFKIHMSPLKSYNLIHCQYLKIQPFALGE